ncbi:DUF4339 domain-containing protein, partial [Akkermansiaceae bacterium]|nr:DUF4339 domain-containing protein [Akkermansiaceae bacterium]
MSAQEWRVLDGEGKEQGPYSFQDLQAYYTSGNITHETMIWTNGLEEWVPAGRVEGLLPNVPQIVPLAPAPTVAVSTQPIATGGINLTPPNCRNFTRGIQRRATNKITNQNGSSDLAQ